MEAGGLIISVLALTGSLIGQVCRFRERIRDRPDWLDDIIKRNRKSSGSNDSIPHWWACTLRKSSLVCRNMAFPTVRSSVTRAGREGPTFGRNGRLQYLENH